MNAYSQSQPLSDDDLAKVDALLEQANPDESMVVEELDGFFAALACSPLPVPVEEWLPEVLGSSADEVAQRVGAEEFSTLERLLERHRVSVAAQLYDGAGFSPVFSHDEDGNSRGNAWAVGFVRGIGLRPDEWSVLDEDEQLADALEPVMQLVEEVEAQHDDGSDEDDADDDGDGDDEGDVRDAGRRDDGEPVRGPNGHRLHDDGDDDDDGAAGEDADDDFDPDAREELLQAMIEGVMDVYDFFREERERNLGPAAPIRRTEPKVGRNDPCPCGSGRKYKNCHGA